MGSAKKSCTLCTVHVSSSLLTTYVLVIHSIIFFGGGGGEGGGGAQPLGEEVEGLGGSFPCPFR